MTSARLAPKVTFRGESWAAGENVAPSLRHHHQLAQIDLIFVPFKASPNSPVARRIILELHFPFSYWLQVCSLPFSFPFIFFSHWLPQPSITSLLAPPLRKKENAVGWWRFLGEGGNSLAIQVKPSLHAHSPLVHRRRRSLAGRGFL